MSDPWVINWDHGVAEIHSLGGMLGPVWFETDSSRRIQPFFVAPWTGEPGVKLLPGLLRGLRGEWPCIPFGIKRDEPIPGWEGKAETIGDDAPHGYGANNDWQLLERGQDWIEIGINYPPDHPVKRLWRRVAGRAGATALDLQLEIEVNRDIDLGIALHPTFRLPETARSAHIKVGGLKRGLTFPVSLDDTGCAMPGAWFEHLNQVPGINATTVDFSRLPFAEPNEDLLQVQASQGCVRLLNMDEKWAARIEYDAELFPSLVLWVSNRGWAGFPWSRRTRALGIEPARAAFDMGQSISADTNNPIARAGIPTSIHLQAGAVLRTQYALSVEDLS